MLESKIIIRKFLDSAGKKIFLSLCTIFKFFDCVAKVDKKQ